MNFLKLCGMYPVTFLKGLVIATSVQLTYNHMINKVFLALT